MNNMLVLTGSPVTINEVVSVARGKTRVHLSDAARAAMLRSRQVVEDACAGDTPRYGINTGFGSLSKKRVSHDELAQLQRNLVRSHAAGIGPHLERAVVRGMLCLQAASLARGVSGIRPQVVETILALLNNDIIPAVPEVGSVGASGDLAPLAAAALALMGEAEVYRRGELCQASVALAASGIEPVTLQAKEGLALINGTHLMAARGALLCDQFDRLFSAAVAACGMSLDAMMATDAFLDARVHVARNQPGQADVAAALREVLQGTQIVPSHRENDPRVQDPYSFRCAPPVLGAALDAARFVRQSVEHELGGVTDNPLVFEGGDIVSAGNFHGMPLAVPLDTLAIALSHIAGISERRTFAMLAATEPASGLVPYLAARPGVQSGLMIVQYTAAACCNEIIGLATPASVSNISTSAGIEDYNSFGPRSAAKAERVLSLTRSVIAIELLCAARGLDLHRPLRSGDRVERLHAAIRERVPALAADRPQTPDIEAITALLEAEKIGDVLPPPLL